MCQLVWLARCLVLERTLSVALDVSLKKAKLKFGESCFACIRILCTSRTHAEHYVKSGIVMEGLACPTCLAHAPLGKKGKWSKRCLSGMLYCSVRDRITTARKLPSAPLPRPAHGKKLTPTPPGTSLHLFSAFRGGSYFISANEEEIFTTHG